MLNIHRNYTDLQIQEYHSSSRKKSRHLIYLALDILTIYGQYVAVG